MRVRLSSHLVVLSITTRLRAYNLDPNQPTESIENLEKARAADGTAVWLLSAGRVDAHWLAKKLAKVCTFGRNLQEISNNMATDR